MAKKGHRLAADEDGKCEITEELEVLSLAILEGKSPYKLHQKSPLMIEAQRR